MTDAKHVLVVEDERALSHALSLKLQHEGFVVTAAANGQEALDLMTSQHFDVALLDLMMPLVNGFQVLEQLKKGTDRPGSIFVLSNLSQQEDEARVLALGAQKFFIKSDTPLAIIVEEIKKA